MTPKQLDEIEQTLAKFWAGSIPYAPKHGAEIADIALPLVKALREAWAALDQVSSDDRMSEAQITAAITEAQKERDDARAEVERLRSVLRQVHALAEKSRADWPRHTAWGALVDIHTITKGMVKP